MPSVHVRVEMAGGSFHTTVLPDVRPTRFFRKRLPWLAASADWPFSGLRPNNSIEHWLEFGY
jgi:hypothetical protein